VFLSLPVTAQIITIPPGPFAPGSAVPVTLFNNTPNDLYFPCGSPFILQQSDGGVIVYPSSADCLFPFPPGTTWQSQFGVPATGPGSLSGSYVFRSHFAAVRMDVGAASPSFTALHFYPDHASYRFGAHAASPGFAMNWQVANTGTSPHTFGAGDQVRIFAPGGSVPLATASLAGTTVAAKLTASGLLPLAGLVPGPYTVEVTWLDSGTNTVTSVRHGIQTTGTGDLQLPGGHVIPTGGVLPVNLTLCGITPGLSPAYAFCIGVAPGSTPIPGAGSIPLVLDAAVMASLANGIGGLLVANVGIATQQSSGFGAGDCYGATGIGVTHPGVAFSGVVVRGAAIFYEPTVGQFGVTQGEDLVVQ
jgi:hypothetical protein